MSIKRYLYFSNILMLVIPVFLSIMIIFVMARAFIDMSDFNTGHNARMDDFNDAVEEIQELADEWVSNGNISINQIKIDIQDYEKYFQNDFALAIYQDRVRVHTVGVFVESPIIELALTKPGDNYFVMNNIGIYTLDIDSYKIILMYKNYQPFNEFDFEFELHNRQVEIVILGFLLIVTVITITLLTNRFLTRMIFKNIIKPLDILAHGVHKIRDGDLNYRISYKGNNEFLAVCSDFNEMAQRLLEMVTIRQKEEQNKRELFAGISHDLRTPLAAIRNYVEGIEYGVATTPKMQAKYLKTIKDKTSDLEYIINQLFHFSKLDLGEFPMQMKSCDIRCLLAEFIKSESDGYKQKGLEITLTEEIPSATVNIDAIQFRNVLTNIIENSLKYGNELQKIMNITGQLEVDSVVITLTDNGPGVAPKLLERLFEIFYRGDKARQNPSQGSGLGLAISAKTIERFGGSIKAVNAPEGGLSIVIILPIVKELVADEKDFNC